MGRKIGGTGSTEKTTLDGTEKLPTTSNKYLLVSSIAAYIKTLPQSLSKLATVTGVDMKTAASTTLYTVPAGKTFYPHHVLIRNNSASLAGGTSYSFSSWRQAVDLSGMTVTTGYRILQTTDNTTFTPLAAAANFQITVTTGSSAACTATLEVWGSLI